MRLTTLLTDLDGVLRLWPEDNSALELASNLPSGSISRTAFEPALLGQVVTGRVTDEAWRKEVRKRLGAAYPTSCAKEAVAAWSELVGETHHAVLHLIVQSREHCRVGLVTNATDRLSADLERMGLAGQFDFIVNSSEVGFAKPSPEIFERALRMASAKPEETSFLDDTLANVHAARALGIRAHHFVSVAGLRKFMGTMGLVTDAA